MAGAPPPAGGLGVPLTRVAARLTSPSVYLVVLGGLQLAVLWTLQPRVGSWLPAIATAGLLALLALVGQTPEKIHSSFCENTRDR